MKIAILVREETALRCSGTGCFKAFFGRCDAFKDYGDDAVIHGFFHSGGDLDYKLERLKEKGVDAIHVSTCMRSKYHKYEDLMENLRKDFKIVVGYTHGSETPKAEKDKMKKTQELFRL
jgi:predicted metal-binding protein